MTLELAPPVLHALASPDAPQPGPANDVIGFGQDNAEAMVASGKAMGKVAEAINAEVMAYSKKSWEDSMAAAKEIAALRSAPEFFEKHAAFAKSSFESFVARAGKLNGMYVSAAKEAFAPISQRLTATAETVKAYRA